MWYTNKVDKVVSATRKIYVVRHNDGDMYAFSNRRYAVECHKDPYEDNHDWYDESIGEDELCVDVKHTLDINVAGIFEVDIHIKPMNICKSCGSLH